MSSIATPMLWRSRTTASTSFAKNQKPFFRSAGEGPLARFICAFIVRVGRRAALFALWEATACGGNDEQSGQQDPGRLQRARLRQESGQVGKGAQEGVHQAARARRRRRRMRLR